MERGKFIRVYTFGRYELIDSRRYEFAQRLTSLRNAQDYPPPSAYAPLTPEMLHEYDSYAPIDEDGIIHTPPHSYEGQGEAEYIGAVIARESKLQDR